MKKIVSFSIIIAICLTANFSVFSQKTRDISIKKVPAPKTLPQSDVKLKSIEAFTDGNGVYLRWKAESEIQNLGFFVYRVGVKGAELASTSMVGGGSLTSSEPVVYGGQYSFFDPQGSLNNSYYIESFGANGQRQTFGQVYPKRITNLTSVAGSSSQDLIRRKEDTSNQPERNIVNLPEDLRQEVTANTLPPDIITQRWVAAQPGVKIGVKQEGIYRVSRTELQNAGFNVNAPSNLWQLYVDGKEQSIIVGDNDAYIEFYGNGIDTPESATKFYYLLVGTQSGKRMEPKYLRPLAGNVDGRSYYQSFQRKDRQFYVSNGVLNGDAENFFGSTPISGSTLPTPPTTTFTINLTGIDYTVAKSHFNINLQGITVAPHQLSVRINGEQMDTISGNGKVLMSETFQIPTAILNEGTNTIQVQAFAGSGDVSLLESIKVTYWRKFQAVQNRISFYTNNYRSTPVSGFTSPNIRVFDLTFPDSPAVLTNLRIDNNNGNYTVNLPSHRGRTMFATEDSGILSASSIIANNASSLATTAHNAELIIVSYKGWMTQANDWANYRRAQGMSVEVVDIDDIYDEFSYGTLDTTGITTFFKFAKDNWQTPPNYILLIGDFSYDFRNYENRAFQNYIPTKRVDTVYEETGSDEALCDFNNDGLAEIAVGRIPARSGADVTQILNKTMTFEAGLTTVYNRGALFASDVLNGYDFQALSTRLAEQLPPNIPRTFINRGDPDSHNTLINAMNAGKYLVNYSGHGSTGIWDGNWFTVSDATALTNAPNYSLFFMLTCLNGYFLRTDVDSLSEALLKSPNGGATAVWASTGATTPDVQEVMATRFYHQLNVSSMNRIGDLVKDAKENLVGGRDVRLSWVLLGDPTMKIKPLQ